MSQSVLPGFEAGRTYRLRRDFEVREEKTGTLRAYFRKGETLTVERVVADEERIYVQETEAPLPMDALAGAVE